MSLGTRVALCGLGGLCSTLVCFIKLHTAFDKALGLQLLIALTSLLGRHPLSLLGGSWFLREQRGWAGGEMSWQSRD